MKLEPGDVERLGIPQKLFCEDDCAWMRWLLCNSLSKVKHNSIKYLPRSRPLVLGQDIATVGSLVDDIPVHISYNIIDLFSGQLYSSPTKAVEELVANSYDAFASSCVVTIPASLDETVWVWDDGDSMDLEGLKELWLVAETRKRLAEREAEAMKRGRLPLGKFGIGKLASYVLGKRITHVCRKRGEYLGVTMDYRRLESSPVEQKLDLQVRRFTRQQVKDTLGFAQGNKFGNRKIDLFGGKDDNWTIVVIDGLKKILQLGRLGWVMSSALPLVPDFNLFLNSEKIVASKMKIPKLKIWNIGLDDEAAKKAGYASGTDSTKTTPFDTYVEVPSFGRVSGKVELYADSLDTGKSSQFGFSNGFFVMVRRRLINADDNRFGITSIPYLAFNKFRAEVHADFLDSYLTANREDITLAEAKKALQVYLQALYNEARNYYEKSLEKETKRETIEEHLKRVPGTLLGYPLTQAIERIVEEETSGFSIQIEKGVDPVPTIKGVETETSDVASPLARLTSGKVAVNTSHPFYQDFADFPGVAKLVIAEVLLEAYLLEAGVEIGKVKEIMEKRDRLLRTLVSEFPEGAMAVAKAIRESTTSQYDLEIASVDGFRILGFEAVHIGGPGKPDGFATAHLGISGQTAGHGAYSVTIDAKSSQEEVAQSGNLGLATVSRHQGEYRAKYSVVVAPGYQGADGDESKAVKEAQEQHVCLIRANDFADLVATSAVKPVSLARLENLFMKCSHVETSEWIRALKEENPPSPTIQLILRTVWKMQQKDPKDAPQIGAIKYAEPNLMAYSNDEIKSWLQALSRLQPDLIVIEGEKVQLNQTPENISAQCVNALMELPPGISASTLLSQLKLGS